MSKANGKFSRDEIVRALLDAFPRLSVTEQQVSLALYRLLAKGHPVPMKNLSASTGMPLRSLEEIVGRWPGVYRNRDGAVIGYWGLALSPTQHRFRINGRLLYTWCAWDTLFIPTLLEARAEVESRCAASGTPIGLTIGNHGVETVQPASVAVSFLIPLEFEIQKDVISSFCHYVRFFASREDGANWVSQQPGTFLLSLDEAWQIGVRKNAAQYSAVLHLENLVDS